MVADSSFVRYYESVTRPSASGIARSIKRAFGPDAVVEVGSVSDVYLEQFAHLGIEAYGTQAIRDPDSPEPGEEGRIVQHDLLQPNPFGYSFDVALSLEVADKIDPHHAGDFIRELCSYSDRIVFSAAEPGQGGKHANAQPLGYWVARFWENGFQLDLEKTAGFRNEWAEAGAPEWLRRNVAVFQRTKVVVRDLEVALAHAARVEGFYGKEELTFLYLLALEVPKHEAIAEIGCFKGRSTVMLALGAEAGGRAPVYAVDHHRGDPDTAAYLGIPLSEIRTFSDFRANMRWLRIEDAVNPALSDSLAACVAWDGPSISLLVLDGCRDRQGVTDDLEAWLELMLPGGIVVVGGVGDSLGPREAMDVAVSQKRVRKLVQIGDLGVYVVPDGKSRSQRPERARPGLSISSKRCDRISIIMPTRNEGAFLRATVDSLLANTFYPDFELIVLDDNSTDGSTDFLLNPSYYDDDRILLIRKKKQCGYLSLWFEGVRQSSGSILKILDSHHCFQPYWLTNLYESLRRRDFQAIVGPVVCGVDPERWTLAKSSGLFGYTFDPDFTRIKCLTRGQTGRDGRVPWLCGHQMMMTRDVYETVGGFFPFFQGHGTDDSDLCLRAFLLGYECFVEPSSVIGHYHKMRHMNNVTHSDIALNVLMSVYLNLGEKTLETFKEAHLGDYGFAEGIERMEMYNAELERFRDWIARRQRRAPEELLESLVHY